MSDDGAASPPPSSPPPTAPQVPQGPPPDSPRRPRRPLVITLVVLLVVLLGGAAYGVAWYTQPQQAIADGAAQALTAPVSLTRVHLELSDDESDVQLDGQLARDGQALRADLQASATIEDPALNLSLPIQLAADDQAAYVKLGGLQQVYDEVVPALLAEQMSQDVAGAFTLGIARSILDALAQPVLGQVDGRWIEIDRQGLGDLRAQAFRCEQVRVTLSSSERARLARTYQDHPPFTVRQELGSRDGKVGYLLTPDEEGLRALLLAVQDTDLARTLQGCTSAGTGTGAGTGGQAGAGPVLGWLAAADVDRLQVRIWLDRWSHEISELTVARTGSGSRLQLHLHPQFDQPVTVRTPTDTIPLREVVRSLRGITELFDAGGSGTGSR